jgi:hypothetical protein
MSNERAMESGDQPNKLRGKWVTVRTFSTAEAAHLVKLRLDRAGIPSYIDNENTGTSLWIVQPAVGGIKLRVPAPFEQQAKEVLESAGQPDDGDEDARDDEDDDEAVGLDEFAADETDEEQALDEGSGSGPSGQSCPACHSGDITRFSWARRIGQTLLVLCLSALWIFHPVLLALSVGGAIYLLITKPDYRCLQCGKRWIAGR